MKRAFSFIFIVLLFMLSVWLLINADARAYGATIKVGPAETCKTVQAALNIAAANDVVSVADTTYLLGDTSIKFNKPVTIIATDPGTHPLIVYTGKTDGMAPFIIPLNIEVAVNDLAFITPQKTYAFAVEGGLSGSDVHIRGEGGGVMAKGSSGLIQQRKWVYEGRRVNAYDSYIGPKTLKNNGVEFIQRPGAGIVCTGVIALGGNQNTHSFRAMNVERVEFIDCRISNDTREGAVFRAHNVRSVKIAGSLLNGDCYFAPMAEGDGGMNLPPGPERDFYNKARLNKLVAENTQFVTGDFKITPGLLDGSFTDCTIIDTKGGSVVDTPSFPYMDRPRSSVVFTRCSFKHGDGTGGRVFSDENGAAQMRAKDCRFLGKVYTH